MANRLAEIEARLKAATGGEWASIHSAGSANVAGPSFRIYDNKAFYSKPDADFIAHCGGDSGDVAWLLAENKRKDELIKTLAAGVRQGKCVCEELEQTAHFPRCERGIALRAAEEAGV